MSKYIKEVNYPWIKVWYGTNKKTNEPTYQYINIEKIESIDFDSVWYDTGTRNELGNEAVTEIGEFLMKYKRHHIDYKMPGGVVVDDSYVEMMNEKQTLREWLEEEGQA